MKIAIYILGLIVIAGYAFCYYRIKREFEQMNEEDYRELCKLLQNKKLSQLDKDRAWDLICSLHKHNFDTEKLDVARRKI